MENWKPVFGFEGLYDVSDHGRVRTVKTARIKKPTPNPKDGRLNILLWNGNKCKMMKVHRLVLFAFVGPPPKKHECCHGDGNPQNNLMGNLRWDTTAANQADRVKHGTSNRGERCGSAKLTEQQVRAIREDTRIQRLIALDYGIRANTVSRIKSGARWSHLD